MSRLLSISHQPATCFRREVTVRDAVATMVRDHVGAAAVVDEEGNLAGMFSERDLMRRVIDRGLDPVTATVGEAMTKNPVTVVAGTTLEEALEIMVSGGFRHLPILEGRRVIAMATVRRVLKYKLDEEEEELESVVSFFTADGIGG